MTENTDNSVQSNSALESNVDNSFFYTNDKFINSLDDDEIFDYIQVKYKNMSNECTDSQIKKSIVLFLQDTKFVIEVLQHYNLNIFELFKILCKRYEVFFKGQYLKKIRTAIKNRSYTKNVRKKSEY